MLQYGSYKNKNIGLCNPNAIITPKDNNIDMLKENFQEGKIMTLIQLQTCERSNSWLMRKL